MYTFLAFISIFGGVVFIHELGHFLAARSVGVKVDRFYVGFDFFGLGLKLFIDSKGTEYGLGLFPFGGYCKIHGMIDESLDLPDNNSSIDNTAFESKNTIKKLWILSAGVIMNFILAIMLSFFIFSFYGQQDQLPIIDKVDSNGPSSRVLFPNSKIIKINNYEVTNWSDIMSYLNESNISNIQNQKDIEPIDVEYINLITNQSAVVTVLPRLIEIDYYYPIYNQIKKIGAIDYFKNDKRLIAFIDIGIEPLPQAYLLPFINEVIEESPSEKAGIPSGSYITKINDFKIDTWDDIVSFLLLNQDQKIIIEYEFDDRINQVSLTPQDGKIGIKPSINKINIIPENIIFKKMSLYESITSAFNKPINDLSLQLWGFGEIINGNMGFDGLGGPVKITQEAGKAARYGTPYFLGFMATISAILGFMNILPIPGLDGGHAFMTIIEGVSRRKIPINVKMGIQSIAVFFLLGLTILILFNDIRNLL
jgi:regulator of sigma E protease